MTFFTVLWTNDVKEEKFDIHEHETLKDAIQYLIAHGANYTNQKIVQEIDWLPKDNAVQISPTTPVNPNAQVGPPPGTVTNGPTYQPQIIDPTHPTTETTIQTPEGPRLKRHVFEGMGIPDSLLGPLMNDNDN